MVVTCLLGMRIPVGPVSKRNLVLFLKRNGQGSISMFAATAALGAAGQPRRLSLRGLSKKLFMHGLSKT
jgi:hypothetical protein